jgi:hypothetical protein
MSDSNNNSPLPTFSGMGMPMNVTININDDDDCEPEVVRRIGSGNPSFTPIMFDSQVLSTGPSITTAPSKAGTSAPSIESPSGWKLNDASVLPEFHPLERTAVFVPHASPSEVASRVSSILMERSIQAEFCDCKAKCITSDNVDFRVFLYRGQKQYSHGIIVEVQRRFGNSLSFNDDTQAILDAAEGKPVAPFTKKTDALPGVEDKRDDLNVVSCSSLDFVVKMLSHPGRDAQYLAFQTLSSLTDCDKMGETTAREVATVLLSPGNEVGAKVLEVIVVRNRENDEIGLPLLAMTVLCNVITSLNGNVSINFQSLLRPILVEELKNADRDTQMAFISAKCLTPLVKGRVNDNELYAALTSACEVGKEKHAGLAEQTRQCLRIMER